MQEVERLFNIRVYNHSMSFVLVRVQDAGIARNAIKAFSRPGVVASGQGRSDRTMAMQGRDVEVDCCIILYLSIN